jgi:hypothetical protein
MTEGKMGKVPIEPQTRSEEFDDSELRKAQARIGDTPEAVMRWVLTFSRLHLLALSKGDWSNRQYEMCALCQYHHLWDPQAGPKPEVWLTDAAGTGIPFRKLLGQEQAKTVQNFINGCLEAILGQRPLALDFHIKRTLCFRPSQKGLEECEELITSTEPLMVFQYFLFDAFKRFAHRIRRCPEYQRAECAGVFLADRRDQEYCSTRCQSRVATQRWRQEHGLITGRPPGRPRKIVRRLVTSSKPKGYTASMKGGLRHGKKAR